MECPYPDCKFVAAPGQAAEGGNCPGCDRPYKSQPSPTQSDMTMRNMPAPGEEDMGGNPLQEGVLGDYQNRGVRDESYASVRQGHEYDESLYDSYIPADQWGDDTYDRYGHRCPTCKSPNVISNSNENPLGITCADCGWAGERLIEPASDPSGFAHPDPWMDNEPGSLTLPATWAKGKDIEPDIEIPAEVVGVLPPDPESIRPDKKRMDKQADFFGDVGDAIGDVAPTVLPIAGGIAGGAVGALTLNPAGVAAGAAAGAGLGGAAGGALHGDSVGDIAQHSVEDAAIGGIGGGVAGVGKAALAAKPALEAAGEGATKQGVGSLMSSAWNKVPTKSLRNAYLMHSALGDASNAVQAPMEAPAGMPAPSPVQAPSYYSHTAAENDTPSSHNHIPSNDTDDPEKVDFDERNDGDNESKGLDPQGINDIGGTDLGPDSFFSPDSAALSSLGELLPKVLEFALGDQSAAGDPDMENLHQQLESEMPGYMDHADDDHGVKLVTMIVKGTPDGKSDDDPLLQDNDEAHDPIADTIQAHVESAMRPGLDTHCSRCGNVLDASSQACPQCGMGNFGHQPQPTNPDFTTPQQMMNPPVTAGAMDAQGPNTDEQKAAVAQLLQEEGREEEIPNMIMNPQEYADELSQISGAEEPPEDIGQEAPPPVVPAEQQGEMPVPGMSAPAPTMARAISKYAGTVDGVAEKCPKCGSHTTGYTDVESGACGCKSCGHHWDAEPLVLNKEAATPDDEANPLGVPLAEAEEPRDIEKEDDSSHTWIDSDGAPLHVGQSYEMYSANYEIPDRIRIDAVKPDVIEYTMIGEYGLDHRTELTHEESNVENISFVRSEHDDFGHGEPTDESDLEQNMDDVARPAPGEETDASTPHTMMSHEADVRGEVRDELRNQQETQGIKDKLQQARESLPNAPLKPCPECQGAGVHISPGGLGTWICQNCKGAGQIPDLAAGPTESYQPGFEPVQGKQANPETVNIEPEWEGMRQWILQMARTDLTQAVKINNEMGSERVDPAMLAQAAGVDPADVDALAGGVQEIGELPETQHPLGPQTGKTADFDDINGPNGPNVDPLGPSPCKHCSGDGVFLGTDTPCPFCEGTGYEGGEQFGLDPLEQQFQTPAVEHPLGEHTGAETGPNWLMEGVPHTAGAAMTPWEQRDYIDETGVARNSDKLNLDGTHYVNDPLDDSFLWL
jgi:hypothetical protein